MTNSYHLGILNNTSIGIPVTLIVELDHTVKRSGYEENHRRIGQDEAIQRYHTVVFMP